MPFESLAYKHTFQIANFPARWLPLIYLYDPDLPLFPIYYFHALSDNTLQRPSETQRVFGYVEKISLGDDGCLDVTLVTNKDLALQTNSKYKQLAEQEVKERFGIANPILHADISNAFRNSLTPANAALDEIWFRTVANSYGDTLPFGRLWDEVLGLIRFVASFYSPSGRKSELIQMHYFVTKFGERIQCSGGVPQVDFYLHPTIYELTSNNPLSIFPNYATLVDTATRFTDAYCTDITIDTLTLSKFQLPAGGRLNTEVIMNMINGPHIPHASRPLAVECFNAFDKGPLRTVIFLLMLSDIRLGRLTPQTLSSSQCGLLYDELKGAYQSSKVIQIYAQQCFGNPAAMPIDTWIETFFKWPLKVFPTGRMRNKFNHIFSNSDHLGKVERLLWVAGQARKVHSSACNDALWCLKYGSQDGNPAPRGANPFSCNICLSAIRRSCPAYDHIKNQLVYFNAQPGNQDPCFVVRTSRGNNTTANQKFIRCEGHSIYNNIVDTFSPDDNPNGFAPFPQHNGNPITVDQFINIY